MSSFPGRIRPVFDQILWRLDCDHRKSNDFRTDFRREIGAGITEVICYGTAVSVEQSAG